MTPLSELAPLIEMPTPGIPTLAAFSTATASPPWLAEMEPLGGATRVAEFTGGLEPMLGQVTVDVALM